MSGSMNSATQLIRRVAEHYGFGVADIRGARRSARWTIARKA